MNNDTISHLNSRQRIFADLIARQPFRGAGKRRHRGFMKSAISGWSTHWRAKFLKHGHGRPIDIIDRMPGQRAQILDMNRQHKTWYERKFGRPDLDVLSAQDTA